VHTPLDVYSFDSGRFNLDTEKLESSLLWGGLSLALQNLEQPLFLLNKGNLEDKLACRSVKYLGAHTSGAVTNVHLFDWDLVVRTQRDLGMKVTF